MFPGFKPHHTEPDQPNPGTQEPGTPEPTMTSLSLSLRSSDTSRITHAPHRGYTGLQTFCPQVTSHRFTSAQYRLGTTAVQGLLRVVGRTRGHPAEAIRNPVHVGVDADVVATGVRQDRAPGSPSFGPPRQRQQLRHGVGTPPAYRPRSAATARSRAGLHAIEADRIDQLRMLAAAQRRHGCAACGDANSAVDAACVTGPCLRRQHRGNQHLERIFATWPR